MTKKALREAVLAVPVPRRLAVALAATELRQSDLAKQAGVSESTVSRVVSGIREASADERASIAAAVGLSAADLFGGEVPA